MTIFYSTLVASQWFAALILVAHAVNKSGECGLLRPGICGWTRASCAVKAVGWFFVVMAAAGVLAAPVLRSVASPSFSSIWIAPMPSIAECGLYVGAAVLVVRQWILRLVAEIREAHSHGQPGSATADHKNAAAAHHG